MFLPKFDNYQGTGATNYFMSYKNSWYPHFFQEKVLFDIRSETDLVWRNIVSTVQSVWTLNNYIQVWDKYMSLAEWTDADGIHQPLENL